MIASFFKYAPERFKNPYVITGLVFLILGMLIVLLLGNLVGKYILKKKHEKVIKEFNNDQELINEKMNDVELKMNITIKSIGFGVIVIGSIIALIGV